MNNPNTKSGLSALEKGTSILSSYKKLAWNNFFSRTWNQKEGSRETRSTKRYQWRSPQCLGPVSHYQVLLSRDAFNSALPYYLATNYFDIILNYLYISNQKYL